MTQEPGPDLMVPERAIPFLLYQRTEHLKFDKTLWWRVANKLALGKPFYKGLVEREARARKDAIITDYSSQIRGEFASIRDSLPEQAGAILSIGCGIGGLEALLYQHYASAAPTLYLLDKTQVEDAIWYGFKQNGAFYNSLEIARELQMGNGVGTGNVVTLEAPDDGIIAIDEPVDLVISTISWGFHYPVEHYLDEVHRIMRDGAVLILDIHAKTDGKMALARKFANISVISETAAKVRVKCIK